MFAAITMLTAMLSLPQASTESTAALSTLEALAREAAPIALVRVDSLHAITQTLGRMPASLWPEREVRVARCTVEQRWLGRPSHGTLFVALRVPGGASFQPVVGERFVVFGDSRASGFRPSETTSKRLNALSGDAGVFTPLANGMWRVDREGNEAFVVAPQPSATWPEALERHARFDRISLPHLAQWLSAEIERTAPTVEARVVTTGIDPAWTDVRWDGAWRGSASRERSEWTSLEQRSWVQLRERLDDSRWVDAPTIVGIPDSGTCTGWRELRVRRSDGVFTIRIQEPDPSADESTREWYEFAVSLWRDVPGLDTKQ